MKKWIQKEIKTKLARLFKECNKILSHKGEKRQYEIIGLLRLV